jgi:xanthine dehydrogenase YagS FAD-binding subunit
MKSFEYVNAKNINEAISSFNEYQGKAEYLAGGTDVIGVMKEQILSDYPLAIIDLKDIAPSMNYIKEEEGTLKIGATTSLYDISRHAAINDKYAALAEAAKSTASPPLRFMGTIGGNICQETRCWYYRAPQNYFDCLKKNQQGLCYALIGDSRYHSIFSATNGCVCVNPSDIAPALVAFNANVVTNKRAIPIGEFFDVVVAPKKSSMTVLEEGEIVTEIQIQTPVSGTKSHFVKFALRKSIDFPIANCAVVIGGGEASICLNAVSGKPRKVTAAEELIAGKDINEENAEAAAVAAVKGAVPIGNNKYKIQIAKTLVKRTILACK